YEERSGKVEIIEFSFKCKVKSRILFLVFISTFVLSFCQEQTLIKNVTLFDGEKVIVNTSVLLEGRLIKAIGNLLETSGGLEIDGQGKTLMPALSNAHVHAWNPESLKEAANAGVINIMDMHGVERFQSMMKQLNDSTNYANYYIAGAAATVPGGHGTQYGFPTPTLSTPEEAPKFVADRVNAQVDYVKIIVEPWKKTLDAQTVKALINEVHRFDKIAVVHVSRLEDAMMVLENEADALVHIWRDKKISSSQLDILKSKNFFVIPTTLTTLKALKSLNKSTDKYLPFNLVLTEIKTLHDAGIPILAGTDPPNLGINYGNDLYQELILLSEAGLSNIEVLKTAPSNVAKGFKLENKGYVKPGYIADLILLDKSPLENIQNISSISQIWKAGKTIK
ncbi:MAG: amidohydrolase family protein, partial [Bacteroidota bacterium]